MAKSRKFEDDVNMAKVKKVQSQAGYRLILSVAARTCRGVVASLTASAATALLTNAGRFAWPCDDLRRRGRLTIISFRPRVQVQTGALE
jgi:hypothetical protein